MFKSLSLFIIASLAIFTVDVRAASDSLDDISVMGASTMSLTPLGPITPDISVVGTQMTTVAVQTATPDVSVVGEWTTTAAAADTTQTECYSLVETDGITSSIPAQATVTDGTNPPGYACFLIYSTGGGEMHMPLASATPVVQKNMAITVGLPIIVSILGLAAIIGAAFVIMRFRARRAAVAQRTWFRRPGGWVNDNEARKMEAGTTDKF